MANTVLLKKSSVASKVPLTTDLAYGELALNYTDEKLYFKNASNAIKSFDVTSASLTISSPLTGTSYNGSTAVSIGIPAATTSASGYLTSTDWNTFNGKYSTGGALGTPSSGTVTNLTGTASININGTVGATTANTGAFTTITATGKISSLGNIECGDGSAFVFGPLATTYMLGSSASSLWAIYNNSILRLSIPSSGRLRHFANNEQYGFLLNYGSSANGVYLGSAGANIFTVSSSAGTEYYRVDSSGNLLIGTTTSPTTSKGLVVSGPIRKFGYIVATLPTAGVAGRCAYVTDALAPTFGATVAGGGAVVIPVFDNGVAWIVG